MRPELRTEMIRILKELAEAKERATVLYFRGDPLKFEAVYLLEEHGALQQMESSGPYMITVAGYDYYQRLKSPKRYWVKNNWFPVGVLAVTLLAVIVNVIVEVLD